MMKAQASVEYLAVISIAMLFLAAVFITANTQLSDLKDTNRLVIARNTLDRLSEAAKLVYTQSEGAKVSFEAQIPYGVQNATIFGNEINIKLKVKNSATDIFAILPFNLTGNLPVNQGFYRFYVEKGRNYVNITYS
jgi:hypothetical protein